MVEWTRLLMEVPLDDPTVVDKAAPVSKYDPEVRKTSSFASKAKPFANLLEHLQHFSDWHQAKKAVTLCLCLQRSFKRNRYEHKSTVNKTPQEQNAAANLDSVNVEELCLTEIEIFKAIQKEALFHTY